MQALLEDEKEQCITVTLADDTCSHCVPALNSHDAIVVAGAWKKESKRGRGE